jgi:ornithine cyclodeaminase
MQVITAQQVESHLSWRGLALALEQGHTLARAKVSDSFLTRDNDTLLLRSAWIDGLGMAVKVATIFSDNKKRQLPSVQGSVTLYGDQTGSLEAMVDFDLVTRYKTVGDSYLAASRLARPDCQQVLIVGAGRIAATALSAYQDLFPGARFKVWNHRLQSAQTLANRYPGVQAVQDLAQAVNDADLVCCATLSKTPLIQGQWLRDGQHIDLIGAYRSDMREADDEVMRRGRLFVDSRQTTMEHIGELKAPLAAGVISESDVLADFYDLSTGLFVRQSQCDITVFKNGGGAHLDLMTARYIQQCYGML